MTEAATYEVKLLDAASAPGFKHMTYGQYKPFLNCAVMIKGILIPVGLYRNGNPAGLALGWRQPGKNFRLLSIFIDKEIRRRGWAIKLLDFMASECRKHKIDLLETLFFDNRPNTPLIEALLARAGFAPPEPFTFCCKCDKRLAEMPMIDYTGLPPGFDTVPWFSLSRDARLKLFKDWQESDGYDEILSPFNSEDTIEPNTSLALRKDGKVRGWAVCHLSKPDTIVYSTLFIMPEIQGFGVGVALQMRSISAHLKTELGKKYPYGFFIVRYDNIPRLRVAQKRFVKYSIEHFNQLRFQKKI